MSQEDEVPDEGVVKQMKVAETLLDGTVSTALKTTAIGLAFGFILNKSRVIEPHKIADQFLFTKWAMMKVFLSASGTSCIALSIIRLISKDKWLITRNKSKGSQNLIPNIIGGLLLGGGMAIAGGCPGLIYSQIGANIPNSIYSFIGGAFGAFTYGFIIDPIIKKYNLFNKKHIKISYLDKLLNIDYSILSFIFGTTLMSSTLYLEKLFPYKNELISSNPENCNNINNISNLIKCPNWPPIIAGIGLGLLQLPTSIILGNTVGGSSSYANIVGQWLRFTDNDTKEYYSHFNAQLNRWWQLVFLLSATCGSTLAVYTSTGKDGINNILNGKSYDNIEGLSPMRSFLGGFIMIFGSRFAKGCASGHGLSGMGLLSNASIIAVASMFAGGAIVGQLLKDK